jgi:hypothetical protein
MILMERFDRPLRRCRILDVGGGDGGLLGWFRQPGAASDNGFGIDLLPKRIIVDRELRLPFTFIAGDAEQLSLVDGRPGRLSER